MTDPLTPRQQEVAQLVAQGLTNREIARSLGLSRETVKKHIAAIFMRLELGDHATRADIVHHFSHAA